MINLSLAAWRRDLANVLAIGMATAILCCGQVRGQYSFTPQPYPTFVPSPPLPPLLFVKVVGPAGMKVTFFRGTAGGQTVTVPFTVGFRPGYAYRMQVRDVPGHPGATFSPTLEVWGSLLLANRLRNPEFPAGLVFRDEDFNSVRAGALVTKVLVLERPDTAIPQASKADDPLQMYLMDIFTISCNLAGLCGLSIPCGFTKAPKMPIGLQLLGPNFSEEKLLRIARMYEAATDWHTRRPML